MVITGAVLIAMAAAVIVWLGQLSTWPEWLNDGGSLSWVRHTLWSDALSLWGQHPIVGAGPGAFTESSELASSTAHLAMAHSSVLQVGSELGLIGVLLFAGILGAGLAVASSGSRPAALIGVAAWTALAVHSLIDHLYEFPVVTIAAGVVIGWACRTEDRLDRAAPLGGRR